MADEQVVKLLEEIRDLQKVYAENYKEAIKNQNEALAMQKRALRRQRISLLVIGIVLVTFLGFIAWTSYAAK